jgi:hypothetical protein
MGEASMVPTGSRLSLSRRTTPENRHLRKLYEVMKQLFACARFVPMDLDVPCSALPSVERSDRSSI